MEEDTVAARFDFPVISEGVDETPEVGGSLLRTEAAFEDRSDWDFDRNLWSFDRGDEVGLAHLELARPNDQRILLTATFEFRDRDTVILKGVVPCDPGSGRIGGGRLVVVGGTGKFQGRGGHVVPLEVRNPWRWG